MDKYKVNMMTDAGDYFRADTIWVEAESKEQAISIAHKKYPDMNIDTYGTISKTELEKRAKKFKKGA